MCTWICHICGDEREDAMIGVIHHPFRVLGAVMEVNLRYCKDRAECFEGAQAGDHELVEAARSLAAKVGPDARGGHDV